MKKIIAVFIALLLALCRAVFKLDTENGKWALAGEQYIK